MEREAIAAAFADLVSSPKYKAAIVAYAELSRDPREFFAQRGVELPEGVEIIIRIHDIPSRTSDEPLRAPDEPSEHKVVKAMTETEFRDGRLHCTQICIDFFGGKLCHTDCHVCAPARR